jgi:hypothetical protein
VLRPRMVTVADPWAVKPCAAAGALTAAMRSSSCMLRMFVLAAAFQDPCSFCYDEFESRTVAARAAMGAAGVVGETVPTHATGLCPDWHTLLLTLLALPYPALLSGWRSRRCCGGCHGSCRSSATEGRSSCPRGSVGVVNVLDCNPSLSPGMKHRKLTVLHSRAHHRSLWFGF